MIIRKIKISLKSLFLLAILLVVSILAALIGKVALNKNSNSLIAQSGLINSVSADVPSGGCGGEGCGGSCGGGTSGCESGGGSSDSGESEASDAMASA